MPHGAGAGGQALDREVRSAPLERPRRLPQVARHGTRQHAPEVAQVPRDPGEEDERLVARRQELGRHAEGVGPTCLLERLGELPVLPGAGLPCQGPHDLLRHAAIARGVEGRLLDLGGQPRQVLADQIDERLRRVRSEVELRPRAPARAPSPPPGVPPAPGSPPGRSRGGSGGPRPGGPHPPRRAGSSCPPPATRQGRVGPPPGHRAAGRPPWLRDPPPRARAPAGGPRRATATLRRRPGLPGTAGPRGRPRGSSRRPGRRAGAPGSGARRPRRRGGARVRGGGEAGGHVRPRRRGGER